MACFSEEPVLHDPPPFMQAPFEEHLSTSLVGLRVICFDLELTGLRLDDEIVQIGAKAWKSSFNQYVLPPTKTMHPEASEKTRLLVEVKDGGERCLVDTSTDSKLPAVDESEALLNFMTYLRSEACDTDGVVLISHGAIFLDIPVLVTALNRNHLTEDFFQIVLGMCDSISVIIQKRYKKRFPIKSLAAIYSELTGKNRTGGHRALVDAEDLYTVLQLLFRQCDSEVMFDNHDLWFSTWTPNCLLKYVAWVDFWNGERKESLITIFAPMSTRLHKTVVHNLVLAGCTTSWLNEEFKRLGGKTFNRLFRAYLQTLKLLHENYLTDSAMLSAQRVASFVCYRLYKSENASSELNNLSEINF